MAERLKSRLWEGQFDELLSELRGLSEDAGEPPTLAMESDPRKVLSRAVGYFASRRERMDYPRYRRNGWPVGSVVTESGVKLFNKRVKGTEQFWTTSGAEAILQLRGEWLTEPQGLHYRLWPPAARIAA